MNSGPEVVEVPDGRLTMAGPGRRMRFRLRLRGRHFSRAFFAIMEFFAMGTLFVMSLGRHR
jgi:hypothetical protein